MCWRDLHEKGSTTELDAGGAIVRFCDVGLGLDSISDSESFSSSSKEESPLGFYQLN